MLTKQRLAESIRIRPKTLLVRSVFMIAALMIVAHFSWIQIFRYSNRGPRIEQITKHIISTVNLTRTALINAKPNKRFDFLTSIAQQENVQVYLSEPNEQVDAFPSDEFYDLIETELRIALGEDTQISLARNNVEGLWVSFSIDHDRYWIMLPIDEIKNDQTQRWIGWGLLVLFISVIGAFAIAFRINRPLRELTQAVAQMAKGDMPAPVKEVGSEEIRTLARAFNQMARGRKQIEDERSLLLAGVSHDLRSPLARIRLGVEMLVDKNDALLKEGIIQDIDEIDTTISQFLDYARDLSSEPLSEHTSLNAMIRKTAERYQTIGMKMKLELSDLPPMPLRVLSIQRLINNLIDNAFRHGGGQVEIFTYPHEDSVRLEVCDRGVGIPKDQTERMLEPFTRMDQARGTSGTGLGLAIVQRIVKQHNGTIELLTRQGGGMRVCVQLPSKAHSSVRV